MLVSPQTMSNIRQSIIESNLTLDPTMCSLPLPSPWGYLTESTKSTVRHVINIRYELEKYLIMEKCTAGGNYLLLNSSCLFFRDRSSIRKTSLEMCNPKSSQTSLRQQISK